MSYESNELRSEMDCEDKESARYVASMQWSFFLPCLAPFIVAYLSDEKWVIATSTAVVALFLIISMKSIAAVADRLRMTNKLLHAVVDRLDRQVEDGWDDEDSSSP